MARYGNRKNKSSRSESRSSGGRSSGGRSSGGRSSKRNNDAEFISLGDLSIPKSIADDRDVQDITEDMKDMELRFNLRVFVGREESIELRNGDMIMVKFKDYEKSKDFVQGKAFLIVND